MDDQEYNKLIETLKEKYYLEKYINRGYIVKIKDKKYKTILGYGIFDNIVKLNGLLLIFEDLKTEDIDNIFIQTDYTCIINIKNNKNYIYIRNGIENYKEINNFPNLYYISFYDTKYYLLFFFKGIIKTLELFFVRILIVLLRFTIPPLGKKLWEHYTNPYNRVIRKRDVDKLPF